MQHSTSEGRPVNSSLRRGLIGSGAAVLAIVSVLFGFLTPVAQASPRPHQTTSPTGGSYVPVTPARIADTRTGSGMPYAGQTLTAGGTLNVQVTGVGGVPATGVCAAVLNVTVAGSAPSWVSTASGFLTVFPTGAAQPLASNLNFVSGQTAANQVTVPVGAGGLISIFNHAGNTNIVVDVDGYYTCSATTGSSGLYNPVSPSRVLGTLASGAAIAANTSMPVTVTGTTTGVPTTASAVVVNLTAASGTSASFLSAYPAGGTLPVVSNLDFAVGQTVANRTTVGIGTGGQIEVYNHTGTVNVDVDVDGYYTGTPGAPGSAFFPITPVRLTDTRSLLNGTPIAANATETFSLANSAIATGATAVQTNVTVIAGPTTGFLTIYPISDTTRPISSDVNYWVANGIVPNAAIADTSGTGQVDMYNGPAVGGSPINVVIDASGYFAVATNAVLSVSTSASTIQQVSTTPGTTNGELASRTYTVTGVPAGTAVDVSLIPASLISVSSSGTVSFSDISGNSRADCTGSPPNDNAYASLDCTGGVGYIESINGVPTNTENSYVAGVVDASGGAITFTVNSQTANIEMSPVVYESLDNNGYLDVNPATGVPTEPFGVGGAEVVRPPFAPFGASYVGEVLFSLPSANIFTAYVPAAATDYTFTYASTDTFQYSSYPNLPSAPPTAITETNFQTYLSAPSSNTPYGAVPGDEVSVAYNTQVSSTFNITYDYPAAASSVTATALAAGTGVGVTWTDAPNPDVTAYQVWRYELNALGQPFDPVNVTASNSIVLTGASVSFNDLYVNDTGSNAVVAGEKYIYDVIPVASGTNLSPAIHGPDSFSGPVVALPAPTNTGLPFENNATYSLAAEVSGVSHAPYFEGGDSVTFAFTTGTPNLPMTVAANASITLSNVLGQTLTLTNGVNATMVSGGVNNQDVVVTITGTAGAPITSFCTGGPDIDGSSTTCYGVYNTFPDTAAVAVSSATGIGDGNGSWNLPASGQTESGSPNPATFNRTGFTNFVEDRAGSGNGTYDEGTNNGSNQRPSLYQGLPTAIATSAITLQTTTSGSATGVFVAGSPASVGDLVSGDTIDLYDGNGNQIATGTYDSSAGTLLSPATAIPPGSTIYVVYFDNAGPTAGGGNSPWTGTSTYSGEPSQTTTGAVPTVVPSVAKVTGGANGGDVVVTWSSPVSSSGPASDFTIYDQSDSTLIATATSAAPVGSTCNVSYAIVTDCTYDITLNSPLTLGKIYNLNVSAGAVQSKEYVNAPNGAQAFEFTALPAPVDTLVVSTGPAGATPSGPSTNQTAPVWTGTATSGPGSTVTSVIGTVKSTAPGESCAAGCSSPVTVLTGAGTSSVSWTFTSPLSLENGTYKVTFTVSDTSGGVLAVTGYFVEGGTVPAITGAVVNARAGTITVSFNENVSCPSAGASAWGYTNSYAGQPGAGTATGSPTSVTSSGSTTCVLNFSGTTGSNDYGPVVYTQPGSNQVVSSVAGGPLLPSSTVTATDTSAPSMFTVSGVALSGTLTLTYDEAVRCSTLNGSGPGTDYEVWLNGVQVVVANETCTGTNNATVTLTVPASDMAVSGMTILVDGGLGHVADAFGNVEHLDTVTGLTT